MSEEDRIQDFVDRAPLPGATRRLVRLGADWEGEPAVWVTVVLDAPAVDSLTDEQLADLREAVRRAVRESGTERWPFVAVRTADEQAEIDRDSA